jgi:hypothetical protein
MITLSRAASGTAISVLQINPGNYAQVTEVGISHNAPANNTDDPVRYNMVRSVTTGGTFSAQTPVDLVDGVVVLTTGGDTATVEPTGDSVMHQWCVPTVSGMIWVAAPGREIGCAAANWIQLEQMDAATAAYESELYLVFEE